ncbi:MAG: glycosyltransferase family 2 protein [Actinobacteria bacterium]|nr:glycosyltransferase family 2 protein [Actinomycetota bacterium]
MSQFDKLPEISVIIPVYNEGERLSLCLQSIKEQEYPQEILEILIIDDDSTDNTIDIAREFGCKIFRNGEHNIERGKSIGLENSSNEFILFVDADNILPTKIWLKDLVLTYLSNQDCFGGESLYFEYRKEHSVANRYCELLGINDPFVYYLKKQDKLMWIEDDWRFGGRIIKEADQYYLIEFDKNSLPTIGSQGFLTKKSFLKTTSWNPYLYHMDSQLELIDKNNNKGKYILMKNGIIHLHSQTAGQMIKKLRRNITLFHKHNNLRKYRYNMNYLKTFFIVVSMVTIIRPLYDSIKGFVKKRDIAWFLHPLLSFWIPVMYGFITIKYKFIMKRKI